METQLPPLYGPHCPLDQAPLGGAKEGFGLGRPESQPQLCSCLCVPDKSESRTSLVPLFERQVGLW